MNRVLVQIGRTTDVPEGEARRFEAWQPSFVDGAGGKSVLGSMWPLLRDFVWAKDATGGWKPQPCPLGEGAVDWPKFFAALASQKFTGPLSIQVDYHPQDELGAIKRDLAFVRKQLAAAYGG